MTPRDDYAFVGMPSMFRPEVDEVHISITFTWDRDKKDKEAGQNYIELLRLAWLQYYPIVKVGGCAFNSPANGYIPGLYIRKGIIFTSRGCNNQCPWCLVPQRESRLRELPIQEGNIVQDNNILQCSKNHIEGVFAMLRKQHKIELSGGIDSRLLTDEIADEIRSLRLRQVFLAADTQEAIKPLRKAINLLKLPRDKVRCYVLLKFNEAETLSDARERMELVWHAGAIPFAQLYQPPDRYIKYSKEWRSLARTWSRPAATKAFMTGDSNV